jgi:Xaa-Pro aminopeptidase
LLEYDQDEWTQRRILEGRAAALEKEKEAREKAEKITHQVPPEFLGIGIRIEDDVLTTEDGYENLTASVPKTVEEIEALCAEVSALPAP